MNGARIFVRFSRLEEARQRIGYPAGIDVDFENVGGAICGRPQRFLER
jgi:NADPH-dependent curcumin reductase CurA